MNKELILTKQEVIDLLNTISESVFECCCCGSAFKTGYKIYLWAIENNIITDDDELDYGWKKDN
jgi:hypothetical protein